MRDPEATAASFANRRTRARFGIMNAYRNGIIPQKPRRKSTATPLDFSRDLVDSITENIRLFLRDKSHVMPFRLEEGVSNFAKFWEWIGATGDLAAAQAEWQIPHNASKKSKKPRPPEAG